MGTEKVCNKCGKPLDIWDKQEDFSLVRKLGYGTAYDGEILELQVCCDCMETFITECVVSPVRELN